MNPSLSMTRLLRLPLTILAFLLIALPALSQAAVSIRVNAGGPTYTDGHGVTWQTDAGAGNGTTLDWGNIGIAGSADPTLYRTERYGTQLHYAFGVPNGSYRVKLHFAENYFNASWPNGGIGQRRFDVRIENAVALHDFDVLAVAGEHTVTVQTFDTTVIDGQLDIDLLAAANNALLNAIEIDDVGAPDTAAPTAPSGLQANAVNAFTIALTWNAATDAGTGVGGYNVYRNGVFIGVATASALGLGFTDVTAQPNTTYTYAVTATDNASPPNESIPSSPATVATPAPGSGGSALFRINAGGLSVVDGNGAVWSADSYGSFGAALNWQSMGAPDVGGTPFSAIFRTERYSPNVAAGIEMRYDLPVPNGTYDVRLYFDERWVTGPGQRHFGVSVNGNVYYVDVYAEAGGQGVPLIRTTRVTVTDGNIAIRFLRDVENPFVNGIEVVSVNDTTTPTPPGAPTALSATLEGGANVRLDWTAPTNAGRGIAGYRVWRDGAALSGATPSATTFLDQFVLYGHTYHYTVSAYDVNGLESAPSAEAVITLPGTGCPAPSQVTGVRATTITSDTISLSWNPATEPCLGVQSYMIAHEFPNSFATVGTVRGNVTTFPDSGLAPATSYTIRVAACHQDVVLVCGAYSDPLVVTTGSASSPPPPRPTGFTATATSSTSIALGWTPGSAAAGVKYQVCRHFGSTLVNYGAFDQVGLVAGNAFTDAGLLPSQLYSYAIRAYTGADPTFCAYTSSNDWVEAFATTQPAGTGTVWLINAGGANYTDGSGRVWSADTGGSTPFINWGGVAIAGTTDPDLFRSERYGPAVHYTVNVPNGSYKVKLAFAENYFDASWPNGGIGLRRFDVRLENQVVLADFDVLATAGAHSALVKEFSVTVADGALDIDMEARANNAMVNAIEIDPLSP